MVTTSKTLRIYNIISQQTYKKNGSILSQKSIYTLTLPFLQALQANTCESVCGDCAEQGADWNSSNGVFCFLLRTVLGKACWWVHVKFPGRKRRILLVLCWLPPSSHSLWDPGLWRSAPPRNEDGEHFPPEGSIVTQN